MLDNWRDKEFSFFSHKKCEAFPCHETDDQENFNCLFCYCPLYLLGADCGGRYEYLQNGVKDCSRCLFPHVRENYGVITERFFDIAAKGASLKFQARS
ncbi:metal-binding protein [Synergistales bacterium]|nr:metal-binding protein [Synergistales bacterium]